MSRTFRSRDLLVGYWSYKTNPLRDWRTWAETVGETEYDPRPRHLARTKLIHSFEDWYPSGLSDKRSYSRETKKQIELIKRREIKQRKKIYRYS